MERRAAGAGCPLLQSLLDLYYDHSQRVRALEAEEAAILARCQWMEETMRRGIHSPRHMKVEVMTSPSAVEASSRSPHHNLQSLHDGGGGLRSALKSPRTSAKRPRQGDTTSEPDYVVVGDDNDRCAREPSVHGTPDEILEECELLFGSRSEMPIDSAKRSSTSVGGAGQKKSRACGAPAEACTTVADFAAFTTTTSRHATKAALRDAAPKKEKHPRGMIHSERSIAVGATLASPHVGVLASNVNMTPDSFWDVSMTPHPFKETE